MKRHMTSKKAAYTCLTSVFSLVFQCCLLGVHTNARGRCRLDRSFLRSPWSQQFSYEFSSRSQNCEKCENKAKIKRKIAKTKRKVVYRVADWEKKKARTTRKIAKKARGRSQLARRVGALRFSASFDQHGEAVVFFWLSCARRAQWAGETRP